MVNNKKGFYVSLSSMWKVLRVKIGLWVVVASWII